MSLLGYEGALKCIKETLIKMAGISTTGQTPSQELLDGTTTPVTRTYSGMKSFSFNVILGTADVTIGGVQQRFPVVEVGGNTTLYGNSISTQPTNIVGDIIISTTGKVYVTTLR